MRNNALSLGGEAKPRVDVPVLRVTENGKRKAWDASVLRRARRGQTGKWELASC